MAMRSRSTPARRRVHVDWGLLLIPLLALVAVWPLLTQSLPSTDDGALHMLRLVQIDRCLRHGVLCLRWAPDFAHGYGYPGFNYYMNLPTLIAELWHLTGLDFPQAMAAALSTAWLFSGWGAYLLGRDTAGRKAGLVVATAYMYAPYQFFDSAYRGNLPEMWALALLPWVLWTGRYAVTRRRWRDIVPCAVAYAALIWTHNLFALIGSPILGFYLLILWWQNDRSWSEARRLGAMVGLSLAQSAFFWIPAFFEQGWTRYTSGLFDYAAAFLPLKEMLAWPPQLDLSRLNPYPPRSLSWGMLILLALSIVALVWRKRARSGSAVTSAGHVEWAFFFVLFLIAAFLPLSASAFLWQAMPPLQVVQMPWRFLGLASLAGSICTGWAIASLPDRLAPRSLALLGTGTAIVLLVVAAVPWTYAAPFPQPENPGVDDIIRWEYGTDLIGGTSTNEFLPIWASGVPDEPADRALLTEHDPIISRLDETSLPDGAVVLSANYGLMRADLVIDTPQAFRARYKQFYFPGWQVTIDGTKVGLMATAPHGLLGFDVPAGEHRIVVQPATTPLRALGNAISACGVLATAGILVLDRSPPSIRKGHPTPRQLDKRTGISISLLALLVLGVKEGLIDRTENPFRARRFDGVRIEGVGTEAQINFGNTFALIGYDLPRRPVTAGDPLRVDLYVNARQAPDGDYMAYARLVDDEGRLWSVRDNGTPQGFRPPPPTQIWPADAYGHWAYLAYTLPGTPPGTYWIEVALFERDTWRGLNVLDERRQIIDLTARIGPVEIAHPRTPPDIQTLVIDRPLDAPVTPALRCIGSTQSARAVQAGDALEIAVFWQAAQAPVADYVFQIVLAWPDGAFLVGSDLPLGRHEHPTSAWRAGEIVRSPHRLRIPAAAPAGSYAIEGTVLDTEGRPVASPVVLGKIEVEATDRTFVPPPGVQHRLDANLENQVALLGYDLPEAVIVPGQALPVTLYWQATREMAASYKVFAQLLGPDGVLAQIDAIPVAWTRPTTGWVQGEVVTDAYELAIPGDAPPGTYRLIAGLYDEQTLNRLNVLDPSGNITGDHAFLQEIAVGD